MFGTIVIIAILIGFVILNKKLKQWKWKLRNRHPSIKEDKVLDEWNNIVANAKARADEFYRNVARAIDEAKIPNIAYAKKEVSFSRALRPFLVMTNTQFRGYEMFVGALDYGEHLNVMWYFTLDTPELHKARRAQRHGRSDASIGAQAMANRIGNKFGKSDNWVALDKLTMLDKQEIEAWAGEVHRIVLDEVKRMMDELHLDFSKVDTHTKGFLNIS